MKSVYTKPQIFSEQTFETSALVCMKTATTPAGPSTHFGATVFTGHAGYAWGPTTSTYSAAWPVSYWYSFSGTPSVMIGGTRRPELPSMPCTSLPQIPQAPTSISTSAGPTSGSGTSV